MRGRAHTIILLLTLLILSTIITPVSAVTEQGLEWGFARGNRYNYTLNLTSTLYLHEYDNEVFDCYYTFGDEAMSFLGDIPENVTSLSQVWCADPFTLTNGSSTTNMYAWFTFVPIGNWLLLTDLLPAFIPLLPGPVGGTCDVIDTDSSWGFLYSYPDEVSVIKGEYGYINHYEFSKTDGVLRYHYRQSIEITPAGNLTVEVKSVGPSIFSLEPTALLIAGGMVLFIVISLIAVTRKRMHRSS